MREWVFRALLRLYPKTVRQEDGDELLTFMRARRARVQGAGLIWFWLALLSDAARAVPAAHWDVRVHHGLGSAGLVEDLRSAVRALRHRPGHAFSVVVCLGLGLGATLAAFSFFYGVLIRDLPFEDPDRLAVLYSTAPGFTRASPSHADFVAWREGSHAFASLAAYSTTAGVLVTSREPERLAGARVTVGLIETLGVAPALGRSVLPDDDRPGAPATIILSHRLWQTRFGGDSNVLGRVLTLDEAPHEVIGVMPAGFRFPRDAEYWTPGRWDSSAGDGGLLNEAVGRLAPGQTLDAARAEMAGIAAALREADPAGHAEREIAVRPLADSYLWRWKRPVAAFQFVVTLVLLLACANVAHLMLAQATARSREMVVRTALGAGRRRIVRQLVLESLLLAGCGGVVGMILGVLGRDRYLAVVPEAVPYYLRFELDTPAVGLFVSLTVAVGVLLAVAPAADATRYDLFAALREGGDARARGSHQAPLRGTLIATQVGLALVVLVAAGTAARAALQLSHVAPGFETANRLTLQVQLSREAWDDPDQQVVLFEGMRDRVGSLPGVRDAALISNLPVGGSASGTFLSVEGAQAPPPGHAPWVITKTASPEYFEVMDIRLNAGRGIRKEDGVPGAPHVVVVNESYARRYWPDGDALGRRIKYGEPDDEWPWMEVVGVVSDVRHFGLDRPPELGIYEPFRQSPWRRMYVAVSTVGDPASLADPARTAIHEVSPGAVVYRVRTMDQVMYEAHWRPAVYARLLALFAGLALVLAAVGVYGVVAFVTGRRTREFGVRTALGASRAGILGPALKQTAAGTAVGLALGGVLSWAVVPMAAGLVVEEGGSDPLVILLAVPVTALIAFVAAYVPVRRALRLDPVQTLRAE